MKKLVWVGLFCVLSAAASASVIVVNPSDDGSLYTCNGCNHTPNKIDVLVSSYIYGDIHFATSAFAGQVGDAKLSVNPIALPLFAQQIDVYGLTTTSSMLQYSDSNATDFLGTWTLPQGLYFGQDAYFDVTSFLQSANTPYVAFILRSSNTDVFSSLHDNLGHASQLTIQTVPEPASILLLSAGALPFLRRRKS